MKTNLKALASLVLVSALAANAQTAVSTSTPATSKSSARKGKHVRVVKSAKPTLQRQIESLREDMQTQAQTQQAQKAQIDSLQQQLSARDQQLQQAQTQAQQAIQQAQEAFAAQQTAVTQNTQAVGTLQTAVTDLTANTQSIASTVQTDQAQTMKAINNPDQIHYKGVGLSLTNSFIEFATVDRTRATGSDIPTPFTSIPFIGADAGHLSEFYATGRQSRLALTAEGKLSNATLRAYYELDWLGTGITSNNNQSNSYAVRERQLWAQAALQSGWTFTGGQMWTLATETRHGLDNKTEILPDTIDPNYNVGFVWARQPGFRITKSFGDKVWVGISAEQAQTIPPSCTASGSIPATTAGGTATPVACPTNYVVGNVGTGGGLYNPTATYTYNLAPDFIAKIAFEPSFGHFEIFGISRSFRDRVYPASGSGIANYNDTTEGGGVGGGGRIYAMSKKVELGLHGLYGDGVGRYGSAQLPDTTLRPDGQLALLHGFSALGEVFAHATPRLDLYADWGVEEAGRRFFANGPGFSGYGLYTSNNTGCYTEGTPSAPTSGVYPPVATGYNPAGTSSCGGSNKDVTEGTAGYDYYFYKGPMGRFRQGIQYSWVERALWSGSTGTSPKAIDNVIETNIRYYLP